LSYNKFSKQMEPITAQMTDATLVFLVVTIAVACLIVETRKKTHND